MSEDILPAEVSRKEKLLLEMQSVHVLYIWTGVVFLSVSLDSQQRGKIQSMSTNVLIKRSDNICLKLSLHATLFKKQNKKNNLISINNAVISFLQLLTFTFNGQVRAS